MSADNIKRAVHAQRDMIAGWFDELRAGSIDGPGVTRDTFGAGKSSATG